jgi:hypothetical protein
MVLICMGFHIIAPNGIRYPQWRVAALASSAIAFLSNSTLNMTALHLSKQKRRFEAFF